MTYTEFDDCNPVRHSTDGQVLVATSASRYNPAYYWVVGTAALPFKGTAALYAMRVASSLLCLLFIGIAIFSVRIWARTAWPLGTVLLALTPVAIFSTIVVAPNGLEICAALAAWSAGLGLTRTKLFADQRRLLVAMIPSLAVLAIVRPLGPGFVGLLFITLFLAQGFRATWNVIKSHSRIVLVLVSTTVVAVLANVYWLATAHFSQVSLHEHNPHPLQSSLILLPSQFLQVFAAFPYRDVPAPTIVYASGLLVSLAALVEGVRAARRELRLTLVIATLGIFLGPFGFTVLTYAAKGSFWQGRYGLPFIVCVPLLIGLALDERGPGRKLAKPLASVCVALLALAQVVSPVHVMQMELRRPASVNDPNWWHPAVWAVALLACMGWAFLAMSLQRARATRDSAVAPASDTDAVTQG